MKSIRDGSSTDIWLDPWIPDLGPSSRVDSIQVLSHFRWLSDLVDDAHGYLIVKQCYKRAMRAKWQDIHLFPNILETDNSQFEFGSRKFHVSIIEWLDVEVDFRDCGVRWRAFGRWRSIWRDVGIRRLYCSCVHGSYYFSVNLTLLEAEAAKRGLEPALAAGITDLEVEGDA
ncbi:uncharacterized protein G2W53_000857 [Senna tora]|uniref:Uncharacterized protein n=1 Tax=Senna tora TaxID=362788 RepID=A0A834XGP5_9FABA|nr:uncharacterized protein G2W53_000857 [Senna tora]